MSKSFLIKNTPLIVVIGVLTIYVGLNKGWLYVFNIGTYLVALFLPLLIVNDLILLLVARKKMSFLDWVKNAIYFCVVLVVYVFFLNRDQVMMFVVLNAILSFFLSLFIVLYKLKNR